MKNDYVLGINFMHSDTSACIFENGLLKVAAEEERFTRIKHTSNFPIHAILFCLEGVGVDINQINRVTINSNPFSSFGRKISYTIKNPKSLKLGLNSIKNIKKKLNLKDNFKKYLEIDNFNNKIDYVDHHESHIASSYYYSNFDEAVNLSIDGFGDFVSCAWGSSTNKKHNIDDRVYFPHSLGIFYQSITQFLGFKNYGDEYKVMGLSSYGKSKYFNEISKMVYNKKLGFELNLKYFVHHNQNIIKSNIDQIEYKNLYSKEIYSLLGPERKKNEKITQRHIDIAKSAQDVYENILFTLIENIYNKYKINNLTLSGGCAMNSVANGKILKKTSFKNLYISPNPGDAGGAVGSAIISIIKSNKKIKKISNYAYLGKRYNNQEIEKIIEEKEINKNFSVEKLDDKELISKIADFLISSKIVGWFQGRMEWGPRALGNRSILADARNPHIKDIINSKIKRRESFRPFAPSIISEHLGDWFEIKNQVPFMSEVYPILKDKRKLLPGITHVDGTGRLQTVRKEDNEKYYSLINNFYEKTNVPIILNTSFNENEPIVETPKQAIECFVRTDMDILVMENWMISRKEK